METYKFLGILDADTIKLAEMKIKNKKRVRQENKKLQKTTIYQKSHQRDKHQGWPPCKILRTILEMDKGRTWINGPENKKINDDA